MRAASPVNKSTTVRLNFVHATARPLFAGLSHVAPRPASSLARRLFLTPARHRRPLREVWWSTEAEVGYVPFGSGKLRVWQWGWSGPAVLLVHGWAGRGLQMGALAEPLVEAGFRVVAYDAPGHGESPGSRSSLPEMAEAVAAMVRHLGEVAGVVAHSIGAAAATVAFGRDPSLAVDRVVYLAPAVDMYGVTDRFGEMTGFSAEVVTRMRASLERRFGIPWPQFQGLAHAPSMGRPLLVIHDRDDHEVPWHEGEDLAAAWPGARMVATEGLGHRRILLDSDVVARATEFLRSDRSPGR